MQIRALPPLTQRTHKHTQGGYFTCHGPDAEHVAKEFYSTQTVVRHQCVCVCARACGWVGVLWLAGWVGYVGMHGWTPPALTFSLTYACTHTHSLTHTHVIASRPPLPLRLAQALLHPRASHAAPAAEPPHRDMGARGIEGRSVGARQDGWVDGFAVLCSCVCVCVTHARTYTHIHTHKIHTRTYTHIHTHKMHTQTFTHIHTHECKNKQRAPATPVRWKP